MPTGQSYATNVPQTTLTGLINASATVCSVASSSGWPATPFTAVFDIGQSSQEPVDVTNITGTTWTITRAIDSTVGMTHGVGATVTHADIGRDFRESRAHIDATGPSDATSHAVHGLSTGAVVGTSETQTLTNKTIGAATFTGGQAMGSGAWAGTGTLQESALAFSGLTGATFQTTRIVGTISTGAAPVTGTFALGDMVYDTFYKMFWVCTSAGSPGSWLPMGGRATISQTSATNSVNVPAWANTIRINWSCQSSVAGAGGDFLLLQLNGDTAANYLWETNTGTTNAAATGTNSGGGVTAIRVGVITSAGSAAAQYGTGEIVLTNAQTAGIFRSASSHFNANLTTTTGWSGTAGGTWQSTNALTSFKLIANGGTFAGGSNISVEFSA